MIDATQATFFSDQNMKSESPVTVLVAIIAAAGSVAGVLYNQHGALMLEREKWNQSVIGEQAKLEREAVAQFVRDFASSFYLAENMIWRGEMAFSSLSESDFLEYSKQSALQKPKLATSEMILATVNSSRHARVAELLFKLRRLDEQLIVAGWSIKRDREHVRRILDAERRVFPDFQSLVVQSLGNTAAHSDLPASAPR